MFQAEGWSFTDCGSGAQQREPAERGLKALPGTGHPALLVTCSPLPGVGGGVACGVKAPDLGPGPRSLGDQRAGGPSAAGVGLSQASTLGGHRGLCWAQAHRPAPPGPPLSGLRSWGPALQTPRSSDDQRPKAWTRNLSSQLLCLKRMNCAGTKECCSQGVLPGPAQTEFSSPERGP